MQTPDPNNPQPGDRFSIFNPYGERVYDCGTLAGALERLPADDYRIARYTFAEWVTP